MTRCGVTEDLVHALVTSSHGEGVVNLSVSASIPAGLTCTVDPSVTFGTSPQAATPSCSASTAGDYTVTVTGTSGSLTHATGSILFAGMILPWKA